MTDEQNKPVRSRVEQIEDLASQIFFGARNHTDGMFESKRHIQEAEARGAAEQRRKDGEEQEMRRENALLRTAISTIASYAGGYAKPTCTVEFLAHAVPEEVRLRVAALEDRVRVLEEALREIIDTAGADCIHGLGPYIKIAQAALTREGGV